MTTEARLPPLDPAAYDDRATALAGMIEQADKAGILPFRSTDDAGNFIGLFRVFVHAPALGEAVARIGFAIDSSDLLSTRSRQVAILSVAAAERSEYEWYAHQRTAEGVLSPTEIDQLRRREPLTLADDAEQVCHDVARSMLDTGDVDDDLYNRATAVLGRAALVELVWIVGLYAASALQLRVHRLGAPDGEGSPQW